MLRSCQPPFAFSLCRASKLDACLCLNRGQPCRYADAIANLPAADPAHKLLCNRSLALCKALRFEEALAAADAAVAVSPAWPKAVPAAVLERLSLLTQLNSNECCCPSCWDQQWVTERQAYWRRGTALRSLRRFPEATNAFLKAWRLANGGPPCS